MEEKGMRRIWSHKPIRYIVLFLSSIFIGSFLLIEGMIIYHGHRYQDEEADVIIILGARLYGTVPSPALQFRLDKGLEYLEKHPDTLAVVSGGIGRGELITEAEAMKAYLVERGVEEKRILMEARSFNTFENITNSLEVLKGSLPDRDIHSLRYGIVTNDYHVFRGTLTAREKGLHAFGIPAETPPTTLIKGYLREYLSVLKYLIVDRSR
jgi:uncharacterized SAM-binding protein YcdF (DUF218 family)